MARCRHRAHIKIAKLPEFVAGCEDCLVEGTLWLHLRICLECGHVGCCDNSPARHTTAHANASGHPVIRSSNRVRSGAGATSTGPRCSLRGWRGGQQSRSHLLVDKDQAAKARSRTSAFIDMTQTCVVERFGYQGQCMQCATAATLLRERGF